MYMGIYGLSGGGEFFDFDEFVLDLGQTGGLFQYHQQFVIADGLDLVRVVALRHHVHEMFAVHGHAHPRTQLLDVFLEDIG